MNGLRFKRNASLGAGLRVKRNYIQREKQFVFGVLTFPLLDIPFEALNKVG